MTRPIVQRLAVLAALTALVAPAGRGQDAPVAPAPPMAAVAKQPSTGPSAPATQPTSRPALPPEYAVLQTRNVFARGGPKPGAPGAPGGPEASFVLKGIVEAEARFTAFFEDKSSKRVTSVGAGEAIALGRIKSINLDAIEYEAAGSSRRIAVGQNLVGEVAPPTPTSKPVAAPPPGAPGQPGGPQPGRGGRPGGPPPQPPESVPAAAPSGG